MLIEVKKTLHVKVENDKFINIHFNFEVPWHICFFIDMFQLSFITEGYKSLLDSSLYISEVYFH